MKKKMRTIVEISVQTVNLKKNVNKEINKERYPCQNKHPLVQDKGEINSLVAYLCE
jgi:hypothetical protein